MNVDVSAVDGVDWPDTDALVRDAIAAMTALGVDGDLSVLLCDDATIQPLNRDWRGKDKPTDVLSFGQGGFVEGVAQHDAAGEVLLGDVVISVPTAARQAEERGHDVLTEVRILLVHGIVHLLGYDHEEDDEAERMEARERAVLAALGIANG